jgi:HD-GYP domain-containing protein (c-di-GMP phosphodiesterase class II)
MGDQLSPAAEELLADFDTAMREPVRGRQLYVELAVGAAFVAAVAAMIAWLPWEPEFSWTLALSLVCGYAALWRVRFAVGYGWTLPSELMLVPMLLLLPAAIVPVLVVAGITLANMSDYLRGRRHPSRAVFALGDSWHAVGPALVLAAASLGEPSFSHWPVYLLALFAQFAFDFAFSIGREWLWFRVSPKLQLPVLGWTFLVDLVLAPIGLVAAIAAADGQYAPLLTLPLAGLLALFARERQSRVEHALELSRAYRGTTLLLSDVLEADDEYTGLHSRDVVSLAVAVADFMELDSSQRRNVEFGALLHDVGKIAVPSEIINKQGPLTDDEWVVIKTHTVEGQRMLDRVGGVLSDVGAIVRSSHERWDGGGYPDGLAGDEIPLESCIVSCCDAFDAMTSDRPYRAGRPPEAALAELLVNAGTQFRPDVADALAAIVEDDLRVRGLRLSRERQIA